MSFGLVTTLVDTVVRLRSEPARPCDARGVAIPYGIYDVTRGDGFVVVGTSHKTPAFAATSIYEWWRRAGRVSGAARPRAPHPRRLRQLPWAASARLEGRTPANGERDWLAHHGRPGPPSGIVESGRASSVRSNQRQSGRTATGQLPHNLPAHPPHPHHIRSPLQGIPRSSSLAHAEGPRRLRERADPCRSKPLDPPVAGTTSPEVHHFSQSFSTEVTKLV